MPSGLSSTVEYVSQRYQILYFFYLVENAKREDSITSVFKKSKITLIFDIRDRNLKKLKFLMSFAGSRRFSAKKSADYPSSALICSVVEQ